MKPNLRLKREREKRGWSQAKLAEALGIDLQTVSRWERGIHHPYPFFIEKLCTLFEKDAEALGLLTSYENQSASEDNLPPAPSTPTARITPQRHVLDPTMPMLNAEFRELVGRQGLLQQLKQRLLTGEGGQMTLLRGLPGVGKTALATALAHDPEIQAHFHDGLLWAGLGPVPNLLGHLSRWGTLLDLTQQAQQISTHTEWAQLIHTSIRERQMLLLLDDAWELETVMALSIGGARCAHVVTTRLPQITHYFAADDAWTVPELSASESLLLLQHFVPSLVASDREMIATLIEGVGGLPLALTLVGRYLRAQASTGQPRRLYSALQNMTNTLSRFRLSEPPSPIHQRPALSTDAPISLNTVIAVSEQRIHVQERLALGALAIFPAKPNSFSEEAALAVCQVPVDVLDALSDAGLLESPEPRRYHLHQTIADYARISIPYEESVRRHFVQYMVKYVEAHESDYNALGQESSNIIAALHLARQAGMTALYQRGTLAFISFLKMRRWYTLALELLTWAYQLMEQAQQSPQKLRVLFHLGSLYREQNQLLQAEAALHEGLQLARQTDDHKMVNHFLMASAEVSEQHGDYARARAYLYEGLTQARDLSDDERAEYHNVAKNYSREMMCVHFTELPMMQQHGYLAPLDDLLREYGYAEAFPPALLNIVTGPDGHVYGLPVDVYAQCLVYNRRLFRQAELDPDCPPQTWSAFRETARLLSRPQDSIYGFAIETIYNQGGWQFTNWLYTAGGRAQQYMNGSWHATFNAPVAVQFLEMLQQMRFSDQSIPRMVFLHGDDTFEMLNKGQVAMIVATSEIINDFYFRGSIDLNDIGLAPMPQNGGNACLMGGTAYVFNAKASLQAIRSAFERVILTNFDPEHYAVRVQQAAQRGQPIGFPHSSPVTGSIHRRHAEIVTRYANVPPQNYRPYVESSLTLLPEPPIEAQQYYALIDPIIQSILMDAQADPRALLDAAAQKFQERFLVTPSTSIPPRQTPHLNLCVRELMY